MKKLFISVLIGLVVLALLPNLASAQFGKNLVVYDKINWKIYESQHFQIYYYFPSKDDWVKEKEYIGDMVRWTENAYSQISHDISYEMPLNPKKKNSHAKPRIFFFWSRSQASHHPLGPGDAIAYAENLKMRMVCVSKEFPDEKIQQIVTHEVCHLFQFSLWKMAESNLFQFSFSRPLIFLFEGWSQHASGLHRTDPGTQLIIKYFVLEKVLRYVNIKDWVMYDGSYEVCYILAGYLYDYIRETYGISGFTNFVKEFRKAKPTDQGFEKVVNLVLKTNLAELDRKFRKYMEDQYKYFPIEKKEPFEYGYDILLQRKFFSGLLSKAEPKKVDAIYEPVVSPNKNWVAGFIVDGDNVAVALVDRYFGTLVKKLTGGYSLYKYGLYPIVDLDGPGKALSFSPNGNYVLYFAQTAGRNPVLNLININVVTKKVKEFGKEIEQTEIKSKTRKIEITLNDPESPEMSKDEKTVIFSAVQNGQRDIFSLNLETKELRNLTNDKTWDYGPSFSPDEKTIVYVIDIDGYKKLFRLNLETLEKTQLTFGLSNETRPIYSKDGKTLWFISDQDKDKTRNIYALDLENNQVSQLTDVISAIRAILPLAENNKLIFGAIGYRDAEHPFNDGIYEMDLEKREPVANAEHLLQDTKQPEPAPYEIPDIDPKKIKKYSTKFYLADAMIQGGTSTFYGWHGNGYVRLTELTNTKHIVGTLMTFGDWYKYNTLSYFDLSGRLQWGTLLSDENHYFYPWYAEEWYNPFGYPKMDEVVYNLRFKRTKLDIIFQYPLDVCHRLEFSVSGTSIKYTSYTDWQYGVDVLTEEINNPVNYLSWWYVNGGFLENYLKVLGIAKDYYEVRANFLKKYINDGKFLTFNFAFVRDTALYKQFGPLVNDMYRLDLSWSTGGYNTMLSGEARKYFRLGSEWAFAARGYGGAQFGKNVNPWFIGDLGELRGYEWMQFMGNRIWLTNFELRFPLSKNFNLFGLPLGDIRVALFMDMARIWFDDRKFNVLNVDDVNSGLVKGSVGIDLMLGTAPVIGLPMHIAFAKRFTEFKFLPSLEKKWQIKFYLGYSF